jgi:hypothetical protein
MYPLIQVLQTDFFSQNYNDITAYYLEILNKRDFMNAEYSEIFPPNKKEP